MDIGVFVEGVSDRRIAKRIERAVHAVAKKEARSGEWRVLVAPSETRGDTVSLRQGTFLVTGHLGGYPLITDTAVLSLSLVPTFSVHNFPNPFSGHTAFVIGVPDDGKASLTVYTRAGERVCRVLKNTDVSAGVHVVPWNGVNDHGRAIAPGTYEYLLDYVHGDKTDRIHKRLVVTGQ